MKFTAHAIFALVFAAFIYPLVSHWVFGGGWLQTNVGMQDFADSTAVHLVGATAALSRCSCSARATASTTSTARRARSRATTR